MSPMGTKFAEKTKERIRSNLIKQYEGKIRDIAEATGYSEGYVRRNLMWG